MLSEKVVFSQTHNDVCGSIPLQSTKFLNYTIGLIEKTKWKQLNVTWKQFSTSLPLHGAERVFRPLNCLNFSCWTVGEAKPNFETIDISLTLPTLKLSAKASPPKFQSKFAFILIIQLKFSLGWVQKLYRIATETLFTAPKTFKKSCSSSKSSQIGAYIPELL